MSICLIELDYGQVAIILFIILFSCLICDNNLSPLMTVVPGGFQLYVLGDVPAPVRLITTLRAIVRFLVEVSHNVHMKSGSSSSPETTLRTPIDSLAVIMVTLRRRTLNVIKRIIRNRQTSLS